MTPDHITQAVRFYLGHPRIPGMTAEADPLTSVIAKAMGSTAQPSNQPAHAHVDPIVTRILEDYDGRLIDLDSVITDQLSARLARTLHAAINGELHAELP